jgi:hypothetical protein
MAGAIADGEKKKRVGSIEEEKWRVSVGEKKQSSDEKL